MTGGKTRPENDFQSEALRLIQQEIERRSNIKITIPQWNDRNSTTQKDVIAVVESALADAKRKGI